PEYALRGYPTARPPVDLRKSPEMIERMRTAGTAARRVMRRVAAEVAPGVTTDHLDEVAHRACIDEGGYPSPLNYNSFPKSVCTSVNEVICHGIPDSRPLEDGDILNIDVTIFIGGVHGDHNETFFIGDVDDESRRLTYTARECMYLGIGAIEPGGPINRVGRAIEDHAHANGFTVVREFIGHGIGEIFHQPPNVPHFYDPAATFTVLPGMTFTVEPMIAVGSPRPVIWDDDWTAVTSDLGRSAQFEHTVLVREDGVEILTVEDGEAQPFLPGADRLRWPDQVRPGTAVALR
ncbi:MAG TPA: type I methionyl aminopeptidase, partial [Acidimicrobiia bacterium]|nr:type I methionyl aminopeptidase [Acidimicrobiia bacterium]